MPYCAVNTSEGGHQIYYRLFPERPAQGPEDGTDLLPVLDDRPRVLLIMGMGGTHTYWMPQIEHLARYCRVCALDNRGTGYSTAPPGEMRWTTGRMAEDALAVLTELGWHQGVHVIGISMGGMIAQELALADPGRVASLSLLATYASVLHALPAVAAIRDLAISTGLTGASLKERGMASLRLTFPEEWLRERRPSPLHGGKVIDNLRFIKKYTYQLMLNVPEELKPEGRPAKPVAIGSLARQLAAVATHRVDWRRCARLRRRGFPIAIVTGDQDHLVRPVNSQTLAGLLDANVHVLEGLGHGLIHQEPAAVNGVLDGVIKDGERGWRASASAAGGGRASAPPPPSRL